MSHLRQGMQVFKFFKLHCLYVIYRVYNGVIFYRPKVIRDLPLKNMEFSTIGKLSVSKEDLKLKVMKLGGKLSSKIYSQTTAIIAHPGDMFIL